MAKYQSDITSPLFIIDHLLETTLQVSRTQLWSMILTRNLSSFLSARKVHLNTFNMTKVDSALLSLLSLSPEKTSISSAGGGGCSSASTSKITSELSDGTTKSYFLKTGKGPSAKTMFAGEHMSLHSIHSVVPTLCPESYGHGEFQDSSNAGLSFLVTDFLDLSSRSTGSSSKSSQSLAQKLAKLHSTPAPIPKGHSKPQFGFPVPTCCGDTEQDNTFTSSWAEFYSEHRLKFILSESNRNNGKDPELTSLVQKTCDTVVPNLIGDAHLNSGKCVTPVVVHGDLWSGNASKGTLPGMSNPEDIIFDSSAVYAHSEFELGIMKMFGGFGQKFLDEYHSLVPKTEPMNEYQDRVKLYELYHHLNHHALFGGGYRSGAMAIMKDLIRKYGEKSEL